MAWVAGSDVTTGDLITAAQWNNYLGATGSLEYLQSWTQNDVTGARAIDATVYRNTSDFILIVLINVNVEIDDVTGVGSSTVTIHSDTATPPTTQIASLEINIGGWGGDATDLETDLAATFVVLPGNYYKATKANAGDGKVPVLLDWFEWGTA